jgi:predicted RNA-binding protein YlqC (UPF0109 family)
VYFGRLIFDCERFMKETVEMIVKALVDDIEAVDVREIDRNGTTLVEVRVAPTDMGKVIGKQGRTVRALRSLAHAVSLKRKHRFILEIVE